MIPIGKVAARAARLRRRGHPVIGLSFILRKIRDVMVNAWFRFSGNGALIAGL
jgi:hypothetical protein